MVGGGGRLTYQWLLVGCPGPVPVSVMGEQIGHHIIHNNNSKEDVKLEDRIGGNRGRYRKIVVDRYNASSWHKCMKFSKNE